MLDRAIGVKAAKMGDGDAASTAPPPFTSLEIRSASAACQLPDEAVSDLEAALMVSDADHV
jgi:hypothetical protein